jgi:hypothetical protein
MSVDLEQLLSPASIESFAELVAEKVAAKVPEDETEEAWHLADVEEAAQRLGRSTRWIRDHKDEIGRVRLDGGALAFRLEDLRAFADKRRVSVDGS